MNNSFKNGKQLFSTLFFLMAMVVGSFSAPAPVGFACPTPQNVSVSNQTSTSVTLVWQSGSAYSAWYVRQEDGAIGQAVTPGLSSVTFTNMAPGTYTIYTLTACSGGDVQFVVWDDLIIC